MKKILIAILILISVQSFGQQTYFRRLMANGAIDSGYVRGFRSDSVFAYSDNSFVSFSIEHFEGMFQPVLPNQFANFKKGADGVYTNYTQRIDFNGVVNKPTTLAGYGITATTPGTNLLQLPTPASVSIPRINSDGTTGTRTLAQVITDLGVDLKAPLASPAFTGTPTGIGLPVYARVTGSNATTTGQALVDITGLSVALTTNAVYEFEVVISASTTAVTTGIQYGINYSVAGGAIEAQITGSSTSTASKTERITTLNTATSAFLTTSGQSGGIVIKGIITTGANAGNLTAKHLKVTSGTSTVFINSSMKVTRIQ